MLALRKPNRYQMYIMVKKNGHVFLVIRCFPNLVCRADSLLVRPRLSVLSQKIRNCLYMMNDKKIQPSICFVRCAFWMNGSLLITNKFFVSVDSDQ